MQAPRLVKVALMLGDLRSWKDFQAHNAVGVVPENVTDALEAPAWCMLLLCGSSQFGTTFT